VHDSGDAIYFLMITLFSMMGNNLISLYFIRKQATIQFQQLAFKKHLKPLFYIFATTMAASIYTYLDILLLGFLSTETSVGYYTAAIKLTKIAIPFITAAGFVLIPKFAIQSDIHDEQSIQALLNKSWHYIVFFSVPISVGFFSLAKEFILVFSGDEFTQAIPTMQLLSMLPFLIGLGYFFAFQVLAPMGRSKEMFYAVLVGMCVSLILNFILIPLYQANGTAITILFTEIVVTSLYFYFVSKYFSYKFDWILVLKSSLSCVFFIPIAIMIRQLNFNNVIVLLVAIGASALSYFCIQYFIFKDKYFKQILKDIQRKLFNSTHE
jgi:O-antigen/teichoic acid export membrane protein